MRFLASPSQRRPLRLAALRPPGEAELTLVPGFQPPAKLYHREHLADPLLGRWSADRLSHAATSEGKPP
jgi:hypothetical protein